MAHAKCQGAIGSFIRSKYGKRHVVSDLANPSTILGAPASVIGAIEGAAEGVAEGTNLIAGEISDRIPRRPRQKLRFVEVEQGLAVSAAKINATGKFENCVNRVNLRSHSSSNCGAA